MEIIINDSTYTLKPLNSARRSAFVDKVLPVYNYQAKDFDSFIKETKDILLKDHNMDMSIDNVKLAFFKHHRHIVIQSIWEFLDPIDKTNLHKVKDLTIHSDEIVKFIEWVCNKINIYVKYVKKHPNTNKQDIYSIYSYLSRAYGWSFDTIKEMDELELLKSIENAIEINDKENISSINNQALAGAYASGNKKAKTQIDSLNRKMSRKTVNTKAIKQDTSNNISRDTIANIMRGSNG